MVHEAAEKIAGSAVITALGRLFLALLTIMGGYLVAQFRLVESRVLDVDRRLLMIEGSRQVSIAEFKRRVDALEAQTQKDRDIQSQMQRDISTALSRLSSVSEGVKRIEAFIDRQGSSR